MKPDKPTREGALAWCKRCSRTHPRRKPCDLYLSDREAKSGESVKRWCHR